MRRDLDEYDIQNRQGLSAYIQSLYVTIQEDELELKYADLDPRVDPDELGFQ